MLAIFRLVRRVIVGSVSALLLLALAAILGVSPAINALIADPGPASVLFLIVLGVVLADLIARFIEIAGLVFPDLIPKVDEKEVERAALIRLRPGRVVTLLSGAYAARVILFLVIFALLGATYAGAPAGVQAALFGDFGTMDAIVAFLREGIAGSVGYFLFFLGPERLAPIIDTIADAPLASRSLDGDMLLAGIRLYGLAFVLALLRTLVIPITYIRARKRAEKFAVGAVSRVPLAGGML